MQRTRGVSLARGPIALIGLLGLVYGASALIAHAHGFTMHPPSGHVSGPIWLHVMVNGWTALLFIAAGLLILFSAAAHLTAKTMAVLVGGALIALAVIGYAQKHGALGIFAADRWTEGVWAAAGIVLLLLAMLPRVGRREPAAAPLPGRTTARAEEDRGLRGRREPATMRDDAETGGPATGDEEATGNERTATHQPAGADESAATDNERAATHQPAGADESAATGDERTTAHEPATPGGAADGGPATDRDEPLMQREQPVPDRADRNVGGDEG